MGLFEKNRCRSFFFYINNYYDPNDPSTHGQLDLNKMTMSQLYEFYGLQRDNTSFISTSIYCLHYLNISDLFAIELTSILAGLIRGRGSFYSLWNGCLEFKEPFVVQKNHMNLDLLVTIHEEAFVRGR